MKARRGTTLVEMLVVCTLLTLVLGTAYSLLLLAKRSWISLAGRASLAINAEVGLERMRRSMLDSSPDNITIQATAGQTDVVGFPTAFDEAGVFQTQADGTPAWQAYLVYYCQEDVPTWRYDLPQSRPGWEPSSLIVREQRIQPVPSPLPNLSTWCNGQGRLIAYDVNQFTATRAGNVVTLHLTCGPNADCPTGQLDVEAMVVPGGTP